LETSPSERLKMLLKEDIFRLFCESLLGKKLPHKIVSADNNSTSRVVLSQINCVSVSCEDESDLQLFISLDYPKFVEGFVPLDETLVTPLNHIISDHLDGNWNWTITPTIFGGFKILLDQIDELL